MQPTTLQELEWIHDCALLNVMYDTSGGSGQSIKLTLQCPNDLGYAPWEGKKLVLTAIDVATSKHLVCGNAGQESIDAIRPGISSDVRDSTIEARRMGIRFPSVEFTISLRSGSAIEIICEELRIEIGS